jgi:hypothetical protein
MKYASVAWNSSSVAWNSITLSDDCKLKRIQQKYISLFYRPFFCCHFNYSCGNVLNYLKLHSARRRYLEIHFFTYIFNDSAYFPTLLESGRGSSVGMETRYKLDGPGIEGQIFQTGLGPTQLPVQWEPSLSREKRGRSVELNTYYI